jgi:hypothetical protein
MKKITLVILILTLIFSGNSFAQNNAGKADDANRVSITPQVSDQQIPQGAKNMLLNKMKQICTKNGLSGDSENPFFVMDATVDILTKDLTPTAPPMHALNLQINFFIKDANGAVFSETSIEAKGVGQNETKAYMNALQNINTSSGQYKAMVDRGKEKILEFYNSQCDFIVSKAKALQKQGNDREAIKVLKSVPPVSKECYDMCMEILATIEHVEEPVVQKDTVVIIVNAPPSTAGTSTGSTATGAAAPAAGTAASPATAPTPTPVQASPLLVGDLVLAQFEVDDFYHKRYLPSKVQTIPSEATKWQTQLIAVTDETPENTWTADILSKWHKASSNELRDGTVVIYTDYEPVATSVWYPGVVVMTDELFKGIVSIKGRWGDIHKVEVSKISIVDAPILRIP